MSSGCPLARGCPLAAGAICCSAGFRPPGRMILLPQGVNIFALQGSARQAG